MRRREEEQQRKIEELIERGARAMTPKQAKEILLGMLHMQVDEKGIRCVVPWVSYQQGGDYTEACLDGDFTADQLEAVATWMRDPKGVAEA
jgi:hypothetical protein